MTRIAGKPTIWGKGRKGRSDGHERGLLGPFADGEDRDDGTVDAGDRCRRTGERRRGAEGRAAAYQPHAWSGHREGRSDQCRPS